VFLDASSRSCLSSSDGAWNARYFTLSRNVQPFARVASDASNGSDHHLEYNRIIGYENALRGIISPRLTNLTCDLRGNSISSTRTRHALSRLTFHRATRIVLLKYYTRAFAFNHGISDEFKVPFFSFRIKISSSILGGCPTNSLLSF